MAHKTVHNKNEKRVANDHSLSFTVESLSAFWYTIHEVN